ncbi:hypothetical protein B5F40_00410 [Gordonibacter sp. An230]|uniref:hypothetical protein n=1 Tax=Gordonibacter sp. An230 TaxID=1965592 RepID=UPI000B37E1C0|nr:hypothetical protein [Gordonibacter sp. An230]OUO92403.1 hypothetical protein B5F40_00410 [Gordonibacter sp. An230]
MQFWLQSVFERFAKAQSLHEGCGIEVKGNGVYKGPIDPSVCYRLFVFGDTRHFADEAEAVFTALMFDERASKQMARSLMTGTSTVTVALTVAPFAASALEERPPGFTSSLPETIRFGDMDGIRNIGGEKRPSFHKPDRRGDH